MRIAPFRFSARLAAACLVGLAASVAALSQAKVKPARSTPESIIRDFVDAHQREIRGCFETALAETGKDPGKLALAWSIDDGGAALNLKIENAETTATEPTRSALGACIEEKVKAWKFPAADKGALLSFRYVFSNPK
jgi:hypothetical protein